MKYGEIEISLHRVQSDIYEIAMRATDPDSAGEITPVRGQARFPLDELAKLIYSPEEYGRNLASALFEDLTVSSFYRANKMAFAQKEMMIRLRMLIEPSARALNELRWELLRDPDTGNPLATSERMLFSRITPERERDWRTIKLRPKSTLQALVAVAAPNDWKRYVRNEIKKPDELSLALKALDGVRTKILGEDAPVTLQRLIDAIRLKVDILYLVCHGASPPKKEPCLFLQNDEGNTEKVLAWKLAERMSELQELPRLVVLVSCHSGSAVDAEATVGDEITGSTATHAALAPLLGEAGVPAIVAMQGKITASTIETAMPVFFRELLRDGQVDRALAVARSSVEANPDSWMFALYLRLKGGRIWYEPGFGGEDDDDFEKWRSICRSIDKRRFVPILGPELGEDVFGGTRELASRLAERHAYPLASYDRTDLAKVTQFITVHQDSTYAQEVTQGQFLQQVSERVANEAIKVSKNKAAELLQLAVTRCLSEPDHPYSLLADLPADIFVNASYEPLVFRCLQGRGKHPEPIVTRWRETDVEAMDRNASVAGTKGQRRRGKVPIRPRPRHPTPEENAPWVYHLFGLFGKPDTMVLTEDDFFDYLIATSKLDLLLPTVVGRLMQSSLLFLGFRLDDWRFRVLFRMIVTREGTDTMKSLSHVGVQVDPDEQNVADVYRVKKYMESYFRSEDPVISIFWGTPREFLKRLKEELLITTEDTPPALNLNDDEWLYEPKSVCGTPTDREGPQDLGQRFGD